MREFFRLRGHTFGAESPAWMCRTFAGPRKSHGFRIWVDRHRNGTWRKLEAQPLSPAISDEAPHHDIHVLAHIVESGRTSKGYLLRGGGHRWLLPHRYSGTKEQNRRLRLLVCCHGNRAPPLTSLACRAERFWVGRAAGRFLCPKPGPASTSRWRGKKKSEPSRPRDQLLGEDFSGNGRAPEAGVNGRAAMGAGSLRNYLRRPQMPAPWGVAALARGEPDKRGRFLRPVKISEPRHPYRRWSCR